MYCELCGRRTDELYKVDIEGSIMYVCESCAKMGKILERPQKIAEKGEPKQEKPMLDSEEEEKIIKADYSKILNEGLAKSGMTIEEIASKLGVSKADLQKIFNGKIVPEEKLARKLEKLLNVELYY